MNIDNEQSAFSNLGPDEVLDAVEAAGWRGDGHLLALNSYENRVYQVGLEDGGFVVAKFYRPGRWSDEAILEEHIFSQELVENEIPVIAPQVSENGSTLFHHGPFRLAVFERRGGRPPELDNSDHLEQLGRFIARIHLVGECQSFAHRPTLDIDSFGISSYQHLLENGHVPQEMELSYRTLAEDLIKRIEACYERAGEIKHLRMHGDAHSGNILWTDLGPHFVDLDDARCGPAIQDLWMFLSGNRKEMNEVLMDVLDGYTRFREFEPRELHLVEALRTLRMMHFVAWVARRWHDPAFPKAFPWFGERRFWDDHILALREQSALLDEPPLVWD